MTGKEFWEAVRRRRSRVEDNLANFLRHLPLPRPVRTWTLATLREKLIKVGAKAVRHAKAVTFQMAEVAIPRGLCAATLERIGRLRAATSHG
jgi:Transposase DDE domain group 1